VAEQERKVIVDRAFPVVKVGVADPRSLDSYYHLSWPGIGHDYGLKPDRIAFATGNYALSFTRHLFSPDISVWFGVVSVIRRL
jgi:hypothetical protein